MSKFIVYPVSDKSIGLIIELISKGIDTIGLVPIGSNLSGLDAGVFINQYSLGCSLETIESIEINKDDTVIISSYIDPNVHMIELDKLLSLVDRKMIRYHGSNKDVLNYLGINEVETANNMFRKYINNHIHYELEIPVLFVGSIIPTVYNEINAIRLKREFEQRGYCVALITDNVDLSASNIFVYPTYKLTSSFILSALVESLNNFVKFVDLQVKPDIMIFHVSQSLMRLSNTITNGYGTFPILLSEAVSPDYVMINMQVDLLDQKIVRKINDFCTKKLGVNETFLSIVNDRFEFDPINGFKRDSKIYHTDEEIFEMYKKQVQYDAEIGKLTTDNIINAIANQIIEEFSKLR